VSGHTTHCWDTFCLKHTTVEKSTLKKKFYQRILVETVIKSERYRPNWRHLTPEVDRRSFCPARTLRHGNGCPDEILPLCLAQQDRELCPYTHSGKQSKKEVTGSVRQRTLVALVKKTSWHLALKKTDWLTGWRDQVTTWRDVRGLL
jgi:ribosome modulation factor